MNVIVSWIPKSDIYTRSHQSETLFFLQDFVRYIYQLLWPVKVKTCFKMSVAVCCSCVIVGCVPTHIQTDSQTDFSHPHIAIISLDLGIQIFSYIYVTAVVMRSLVHALKLLDWCRVDVAVSQLPPVWSKQRGGKWSSSWDGTDRWSVIWPPLTICLYDPASQLSY